MMTGLICLPHSKYNDFVFETDHKNLILPFCDIVFLAVDYNVKVLRLQKLCLDG